MSLPVVLADTHRMTARASGNIALMLAKQAANPKQIAEAIWAFREAADMLERATSPATPAINPPSRRRA